MSIERRLAAKERSRKARTKATVKKWAAILCLPVLAVIILSGYLIYKSVTTVNYSKYISKDGTIQGVSPRECFSEFPNLDDVVIDIEPTDDEVQAKLKSTIQSLEEAAKDASELETSENTTETIDYLSHFNQEWVEQYAAETLGDKYPVTEEGFLDYVTDLLREANKGNAKSYVSSYMEAHTAVKSYPFWFTKNQKKILAHDYEATFEQWKEYGLFGEYEDYESYVLSIYETKSAYRKSLKKDAKASTKTYLIWLTVFDELNLTATIADSKAYEISRAGMTEATDEEKEKYWNSLVEEYGEPYLMLEYRQNAAMEALAAKVLAKMEAQ